MQPFGALLVALLTVNSADWELYKRAHGKSYTREDEPFRRKVYEINVAKINAHNLLYDLKLKTFRMGINQFTDQTFAERKGPKCVDFSVSNSPHSGAQFDHESVADNLPEFVDWTQKGYVTPVKNQGKCGSCWAFSAVGALEAQHFNATRKLVSLSTQNLIDCSWSEANSGCSSGLPENAFRYIQKNGGIASEESYPYTGANGNCRFKKELIEASIRDFVAIAPGNEKALQKAVATIGPVSVLIDASSNEFQFYGNGIFRTRQCSTTDLHHAVLVVGYGVENGVDYWLVKNSWGTRWGINGYVKMPRNNNNYCGIATRAFYPLV